MTREQAIQHVGHYLDDALYPYPSFPIDEYTTLVGWQCGFEPMFVAVRSYLPEVKLDSDCTEEIATDYLEEIKWFAAEPLKADYVL